MSSRRAFYCWVPCIGGDGEDNTGVYRAETRSKAKYLCYLNAHDAGFDIGFPDIRVRRAPAFDVSQFNNGTMPEFITAVPIGGAA